MRRYNVSFRLIPVYWMNSHDMDIRVPLKPIPFQQTVITYHTTFTLLVVNESRGAFLIAGAVSESFPWLYCMSTDLWKNYTSRMFELLHFQPTFLSTIFFVFLIPLIFKVFCQTSVWSLESLFFVCKTSLLKHDDWIVLWHRLAKNNWR